MFKVLILQAINSLSDERKEFLIEVRLSFMRLLGRGLSDPVPDANTILTFREALTRSEIAGRPAIAVLFSASEAVLRRAGFLAMGGQIVNATVVAAFKQRSTEAEKAELKAGRAPDAWKAKLGQKDRDAPWTIKWSRVKPAEDGSKRINIKMPAFGYKNHVGIDRRHRLIWTWSPPTRPATTGLSCAIPPRRPTASDVWADMAYHSKASEAHLAGNCFRSYIHCRKPPGKPMARNFAWANSEKSKIRAAVEHVFARQKAPMGLVMRTIGLARARMKIGLANLTYNMNRAVWLTGSRARTA